MNEVDLANCLRESADPILPGRTAREDYVGRRVGGALEESSGDGSEEEEEVDRCFPSSQGLAELSAEDVEEYVPTKEGQAVVERDVLQYPQSFVFRITWRLRIRRGL